MHKIPCFSIYNFHMRASCTLPHFHAHSSLPSRSPSFSPKWEWWSNSLHASIAEILQSLCNCYSTNKLLFVFLSFSHQGGRHITTTMPMFTPTHPILMKMVVSILYAFIAVTLQSLCNWYCTKNSPLFFLSFSHRGTMHITTTMLMFI